MNSPRLMTPSVGSSRPRSALRSVDFPLPFGPTMAMTSFWSMRVVKPLSSSLSPSVSPRFSTSKSIFCLLILLSRLKCFASRWSSTLILRIFAGFVFASSRRFISRSFLPSLRLRRARTPRANHSFSRLSTPRRLSCCFCSVLIYSAF